MSPSQVELEVTLDSEGRDRVFRVTIKWVAQVNDKVMVSMLILMMMMSRCHYLHWRRPWKVEQDRFQWTPFKLWTW